MRTWETHRNRSRRWAFVGFLVVALATVSYIVYAIVSEADVSQMLAIVYGFSAVGFFLLWRTTRVHTTVSEQGIEVYDGLRKRRVGWEEVDGVHGHGRFDEIVKVSLVTGKSLVLPGVQRNDIDEVAGLIEAYVGDVR